MALKPTGKLFRLLMAQELGSSTEHVMSQKAVTDSLNTKMGTVYTKAETDTRLNSKVPTSRKVNGKALTADISLSASDVGTYTKAEIDSRIGNYVPSSRKVNGKALTGDISLSASDVGAWPIGQAVASANQLATPRSINGTAFNGSADITTSKWGAYRYITIGSGRKNIDGSADFSFSLDEIGVYSKGAIDGLPRIYSGAGDPPNSLGKDGDIYIKY